MENSDIDMAIYTHFLKTSLKCVQAPVLIVFSGKIKIAMYKWSFPLVVTHITSIISIKIIVILFDCSALIMGVEFTDYM